MHRSHRPSQHVLRALFIAASLAGCTAQVEQHDDDVASGTPSFEEYLASLPRTPNGAYLVEGDMPFTDRDKLRDIYEESISDQALLINSISATVDDKLSATRARNMNYCVSNEFATAFPPTNWKATVVAAMTSAAGDWESAAGTVSGVQVVDFKYLSAHDANCLTTNTAVDFVVRPSPDTDYDASAPFPSDTGTMRTLWITKPGLTPSAPVTLVGTLKHELGHALGFRHEHARITGDPCGEAGGYRAISPYNQLSVMHYSGVNSMSSAPCGYDGTRDWALTAYDRNGAKCIYNTTADSCKGMLISAAAPQFTADNIGTVYRYNTANTRIEKYEIPTSGALPTWTPLNTISGTRRIMAGGTKLYRINDANGALSRWNAGSWTALGSSGASTVVAYTGGHAYRLNTNGSIERVTSTGTVWSTILPVSNPPVTGRSIFPGTTNVFRRDSNGSVYQWTSGTSWTLVATAKTSIAQDRTGAVYTLDSGGTVRRYNMSVTPPTPTTIGTGMASIKGGLDTIYATPSAIANGISRYRSGTTWTDHGRNISVFFGGGPRKLARMSGTGGTTAGELFDYLYPSPN